MTYPKLHTLLILFAMTVALVIASSVTAIAQADWKVVVSRPASVITSSSFNLDYSIMTVDGGQTFDVFLLNNGSPVSGFVQTVVTSTEKLGASGRFSLSNVPEGTYSYSVLAKNRTQGNEQLSDSAPFTVNLPDSQTVVVSGDNPSTVQNEGVDVAVARTNTTAAGDQVATAATTAEMGNGLTEVSSTEAATNVAAATNNNTRNFAFAGLALLVLVGAVLWFGITRFIDKNET